MQKLASRKCKGQKLKSKTTLCSLLQNNKCHSSLQSTTYLKIWKAAWGCPSLIKGRSHQASQPYLGQTCTWVQRPKTAKTLVLFGCLSRQNCVSQQRWPRFWHAELMLDHGGPPQAIPMSAPTPPPSLPSTLLEPASHIYAAEWHNWSLDSTSTMCYICFRCATHCALELKHEGFYASPSIWEEPNLENEEKIRKF